MSEFEVFQQDAGRVTGVLLDIDDTLVDLEFAMTTGLRTASEHLLPGLDASGWDHFFRIFTHETTHIYDRYLAGELSFQEQRVLRGRTALAHFGVHMPGEDAELAWVSHYASIQEAHVRPFADVHPFLDALDAAGIPYGAVSNNVHSYQRAKLDRAGLQRIAVLVGTDTVGVAKPDPAIFLEGVRLLGGSPAETLYVGDNRLIDCVGSTAAGLRGVWLNRSGNSPDSNTRVNEETVGHGDGSTVSSLLDLLPLG
ncbi:HAD family hydrolase [Pseudarthrobacter sp. J1763]|uniref:HAD family hydrolase n=1 Tax=Pseudarthrobacter sp. J1763 TaxID=3420445 RepID=UPI003D2E4694